jgi:hypothetical protein
VAYAPSFGLRQIDTAHAERVGNCLSDFASLSAREQTGVEIIRSLTGRDVPLVCDPTFLLTRADWERIASCRKIKKPYVLVYAFGAIHLDEKAKIIAKKKNAIVVDINRCVPSLSKDVRNVSGISPAEFLSLIANAEYVVTCSFHGMALSVLMEKEFAVYLNNYTVAENTNPRFESLADKIGLQNRIRTYEEEPPCDAIDYTIINQKIERWRMDSRKYLQSAVMGRNE